MTQQPLTPCPTRKKNGPHWPPSLLPPLDAGVSPPGLLPGVRSPLSEVALSPLESTVRRLENSNPYTQPRLH
eukprot:475623-Pyramimonas_sp.AAC.1